MHLRDSYSSMTPQSETEIDVFDPVTDRRIYGVKLILGDKETAPKLTAERLPSDKDKISSLGVETEYGRRVILRATGKTVDKFMASWHNSDNILAELDKLQEAVTTFLEGVNVFQMESKDIVLDLVSQVKIKVEEAKKAHENWQAQQLQFMYQVMFPGGK